MREERELRGRRGSRRAVALELALVVIIAFAVLAPGISRYSLVDPWETHYGEVARLIRHNHDWVHLDWAGAYLDPNEHEGFRSKPALSFWLMAASMTAFGVADSGGYSGEMVDNAMTAVAVRLPFIAMAVLGLVLMWWMLLRLVSRRLAWLGLLVVGSTPMFALISRQAIPDMPHLACLMGAIAMFAMALESGDRPIGVLFTVRLGRRRVAVTALHAFLAIVGGFVLVQCAYYVAYFLASPRLAVRQFPQPVLFFPLFMGLLFGALSRRVWMTVRVPLVLLVRVLAYPVVRAAGGDWPATLHVADRVLGMAPLATMRQVYMLWCYAFLGLGILAKGPPGFAVFGVVAALHVVLTNRWRDLYDGCFEIKRGLLLMIVVFLPWHIAMYLKAGVRFVKEYLFFHILSRGGSGVDDSAGTFATIEGVSGGYAGIIGHGMWLWAALLPAALAAALLRARTDTREGRVRFVVALWAVGATTLFFIISTKFHHYILPAIPALGLLVAFFLDDIVAGRDRLHPVYAALGVGIVLLMTRDLMWSPERWIEMFVYRYDRAWPGGEPYAIDPSDGFFGLGILAAIAIIALALPWRRIGVALVGVAGLAICIWALQVYMPDAGTHWGMREAMRDYYRQRTIHGHKNVYFSARQIHDDWHDADGRWTFQTMVPDTLHLGQPMTIRVQLNRPDKPEIVDQELGMIGTVTRIGDHEVEVTIPPRERAKLEPLVAKGRGEKPRRVRAPIRVVEADRLIAWILYWRGENFWSGNEIFGPVPEMRTGFNKPDNAAFLKYLGDRTRAPFGRRYFVITEAGRDRNLRAILPTQRAKETLEVVNTDSNKFTLVSFYL